MSSPFFIKNCVISAISTCQRAFSLSELRDLLSVVPLNSIYYHFWGQRLASHYTIPEYHNDFALWAHQSLKDEYLREQFSILDPNEYVSWEQLRQDLIEIVESRLDNFQIVSYVEKDPFYFIQSTLVVFDSSYIIEKPEDILIVFNNLSLGSIYYHFIDAFFRNGDKKNDLIEWLKNYGPKYKALIEQLETIDAYFFSLSDLKLEIFKIIEGYFGATIRKV